MKNKYVSILLILILLLTMVTPVSSFAQVSGLENGQKQQALGSSTDNSENMLDFTMFSGSSEAALTINSTSTKIKGNIHTNNDFVSSSSNLTVDGKCESSGKVDVKQSKVSITNRQEKVPNILMVDFISNLKKIASENANIYTGDKNYYGNSINIAKAAIASGSITFSGSSFNSKGYIIASKDITFNTDSIGSSKGIVICSENGNITVNGSKTVLTGILYAPKGTVTINAADFKLNGRIIADKIIIRGKNIEVTGSKEDLNLIYTESDIIISNDSEEFVCNSAYKVAFTIVDVLGKPVPNVQCSISTSGDAVATSNVVTDANGSAVVSVSDVTPQTVTLTVTTKKGLSKARDLSFIEDDPVGRVAPLNPANIIVDEEGGFPVVKNQILVVFKENVSEVSIKELVNSIGGKIVGYIKGMNDYQIEISGDNDLAYMKELIDQLDNNELVEEAMLNEVVPLTAATPEQGKDPKMGEWDESNPSGNNWGLEAIYAPSAWEYNNFLSVKVGMVDTPLMINHEDLSIPASNFKYGANGSKVDNKTILAHGTHVAGIIGATSNNDVGVTGILWKKDLFCFGYQGDKKDDSYSGQIFEIKYGIAWLLEKGCKVINISLGNYFTGARINKPTDTAADEKRYITKPKNYWTPFMKRLLNKYYDFLIVQAGGNDNIDAKWTGLLCSIDDTDVLNHVIIVGAIKNGKNKSYSKDPYSNFGSEIDVAAPGVDIYSSSQDTYYNDPKDLVKNNYYQKMSGTSMAAPHVSGVAGLVWEANPKLTASQVKNIIVDTADRPVSFKDSNGKTVLFANILNAKKAVERALSTETTQPPRQRTYGILNGRIVDAVSGNRLEDATITVYNNGTGDFYYASTLSDVDGSYEMVLEPGSYNIIVDKPGYISVLYSTVIADGVTMYSPQLNSVPNNYSGIGTVQGRITNALDKEGLGVKNITIKFRKGINITSGPVDYTTTTDNNGNYSLSMEAGNYTGELGGDGYITGYFYVISIGTITAKNQNGVVSPVIEKGETRIVLTWGPLPTDLDSHLSGPGVDGNKLHVYYHDKNYDYKGVNYVNLDVDDTTSYGPETTTIHKKMDGKYTFTIHDFTHMNSLSSMELSNSGAEVRVYRGGTLLATFNVPTNHEGTAWTVFEMDGDSITPINNFYYTSMPESIRSLPPTEDGSLDEAIGNENILRNLPDKSN